MAVLKNVKRVFNTAFFFVEKSLDKEGQKKTVVWRGLLSGAATGGGKQTGGDGRRRIFSPPLDGKIQVYSEILVMENRFSTREKKSGRAEDLCTVTTLLCKVEKSECDGGISDENMVP